MKEPITGEMVLRTIFYQYARPKYKFNWTALLPERIYPVETRDGLLRPFCNCRVGS